MSIRMRVSKHCEAATEAAIQELGLPIQPYGQGMLTVAARQMLRGVPTAERWKADFLVRTPHRSVLVDAKFSFDGTVNHSIEMRSLLVAGKSDLPTFYVCSTWKAGGLFVDFVSMHYQEVCVTGPSSWPCCHDCAQCFGYDPDPMRNLPEYCPTRQRGDTASRTPFFVVKPPFRPLTAHEFDLEPRFAGSGQPPARVWDHNVRHLTPRKD